MKFKIFNLLIIITCIISSGFIVYAKENYIDLSGYVIYIDAGHGGKDNGASYEDILEDSINLEIAKQLVSDLIDLGAMVITSRDSDYDLASNYDKNRKNKDLKRRVELINEIKPHLFISIHLNTFPSVNVHGGQVFAKNEANSINLANILQDKLNSLSNRDKKIKIGDYYLLNKSEPVGVLIECGFLTSEIDRNNLMDENYQKRISKVIVSGINEYLKITYL